MYTTGEPCAMCQGAIMFSHLGRMVYASSIATITKYGRGQIQIPSWEITHRSPKEHFVDTEIVPDVLREQTDEWFKWQFDPEAPCPSGCQRHNGTCTDI
ncbi:hypothetical protein K7432_015680 [Basidiobolus ranarum]|uniref:CMP/dCMP-type deaminase domain-containing protein n=1 Tax=Basidiobolus ranarum TaxID=34480 RepID=A0ABR2WFU4_9FUNG